MKNFTCVQDIGNLKSALDEAFEIKKDRFKYVELGRNKTLMMIFFNSSLRTRLSTTEGCIESGHERNCTGHQPGSLETGDRAWCHHGR